MSWLADNAGLVGLLFFFGVFTGIAIWAYRPANKSKIEALKNIPLADEDNHGRA